MNTISCVSITRENGKYVGKLLNMNGVVYETTTNTLRGTMWALTQIVEEYEEEGGVAKDGQKEKEERLLSQ